MKGKRLIMTAFALLGIFIDGLSLTTYYQLGQAILCIKQLHCDSLSVPFQSKNGTEMSTPFRSLRGKG